MREGRAARGERPQRNQPAVWWRSVAGILMLLAAVLAGVTIDWLFTHAAARRTALAAAGCVGLTVLAAWAYLLWGFGPPSLRPARGAHRRAGR